MYPQFWFARTMASRRRSDSCSSVAAIGSGSKSSADGAELIMLPDGNGDPGAGVSEPLAPDMYLAIVLPRLLAR